MRDKTKNNVLTIALTACFMGLVAAVHFSFMLVQPATAQGLAGNSALVLENGLSTTVKTVKGTRGTITLLDCINPNASAAYVQVFDVASATTVTLGTTVPKGSFGFAATSARAIPLSIGANMLNGIKAAATTTATGLTAPGVALDCTFMIQ